MQVLLGVDVGSSGCKVTAIDLAGKVVANGAEAYATRYPRPGWAEQDPEDWVRSACTAIRRCLAGGQFAPQDVIGLAIVGPAHNVALMDAAGAILYPTIHWSDLRSIPQCERLEALCGQRIFQVTFQRVNPSWTLAQLLWLKENEPDVWAKLRRVLVTKDYVRYRFTGEYQTDVYDAIGLQLYDVEHDCWSAEMCDLIGFPAAWLPPVYPVSAIAGTLSPDAAAATGLPVGVPVAIGSSDVTVEAFGVGAIEPGHAIVKLGTAACVNLVTVRLRPSSKSLTYRHIVAGRGFTITATNSGAATMRWFRDVFGRYESAQAGATGANVFELIGDLAAQAPPGCEGLLFHPFLMGERSPYWDPQLRADFVGIGAHHQIRHFARAILEGVAFSLRDCAGAVQELGEPIADYRIVGGGSKSPLWRQIICDVLGEPLIKPAVDDAAFGAALLAGVAVGVFADWRSAVEACVRIEEVLYPNPQAHALYSDYFEVYRGVVRDLAAHSHRLAELGAK
jgi:xylulokinase